MKIVRLLILLILSASILSIRNGSAALPNVSEVIDEAPTAKKPRQIVSSDGLLSPQQSKAIMERLKRSVDPTDILERHTAVIESVTESPLTKGNKVTLLADGQATYAAMFKVIKSARDHINLESYIIEDDETGRKFADLLLQKQAGGVQVNLIYDSMGSMKTPVAFFQRLRDGGIQVVEFNPVNPLEAREKWGLTHRDHRKILIVDGKVAIMGGINISKVYSSSPLKRKRSKTAPIHWRDTDVQIQGPAVAEFQKLFLDTWKKQKGPKLSGRNYFPVPAPTGAAGASTKSSPAGKAQENVSGLLKDKGNALVRVVGSTPGQSNRIPFIVYVSAIVFAENSIHMTNSYFIPDDQIIKALTDAARRGVDVKIVLPGITDSRLALYAQRHYYSRLLKSGVKIYEHSTALLHAKTAVVDNVWSTVGSTNMDFLSLLNNDEVNAVVLNKEFAAEMEGMFVRDLADSRRIQLNEWKKRPLFQKILEWFVNLFIRWL
ncbi:MAG: cardiolipin synthase B [Steroidobacteraceae bacterium]|nr:cardiolipin synthase B [Deltaproteobacteria bacterium]